MIDEEYIKQEITRLANKRDRARRDKCEFVARKYEREIAALTKEFSNTQSVN